MLEASTHVCEGCADVARLRLEVEAEARSSGLDEIAVARSLAGLSYRLSPFRPPEEG